MCTAPDQPLATVAADYLTATKSPAEHRRLLRVVTSTSHARSPSESHTRYYIRIRTDDHSHRQTNSRRHTRSDYLVPYMRDYHPWYTHNARYANQHTMHTMTDSLSHTRKSSLTCVTHVYIINPPCIHRIYAVFIAIPHHHEV